ncbi:MAG: hypothetical protein CVV46_02005 [Spirochaetae bacterium HGW-Spirochaetae-2]|nr:MAG: hypothetical protein CVV46_02005 [Spirochaetae bacterium HGW-Spirochaetae-2]
MSTSLNVHERVVGGIRKEREALSAYGVSEIIGLIESGNVARAVGHAFYFSSPDLLKEVSAQVADILQGRKEIADTRYIEYVAYAVSMAVGLDSAQIKWRLIDLLSKAEIARLAALYRNLVAGVKNGSVAVDDYLAVLAQEVYDRYVTEARSKEDAVAAKEKVLAGTLADYVDMMIKDVHNSNLYAYAMGLDSVIDTGTVWGNDFGAFLQFALWCGASFQTTNPPLVKMAWDLDPALWTKRVAAVYASLDLSAIDAGQMTDAEKKVAILTYSIVEYSCQFVRDLYLFSEGALGFVCYQVNPNHHGNTRKMVDEVSFVHAVMGQRLGSGFEPNISFKIPGTNAALLAAKAIGKMGISLTITLSFGVFQAMEFGKVFADSTAAVNSVVIMNGRLAFPVRDQLLAEHPDKKDYYVESAKWVGVDVTRHLYEGLYSGVESGGLGLDPKRVRIMNASLRIYGLEIPDVMEIWGSPSITIFPNVRHALDLKARDFDCDAVRRPIEESVRIANADSEIFRQSWYYDGDAKAYAPASQLVLANSEPEVITTWVPIAETLSQFLGSYASTRELIGFMS